MDREEERTKRLAVEKERDEERKGKDEEREKRMAVEAKIKQETKGKEQWGK